MKNLYRITNAHGVTLCFQVAKTQSEAVDAAQMYGHRSARFAQFVRVND